jgi:PilZ domain
MFAKEENRLNDRRVYDAPVILYTKDNSDDYHNGHVCNYSSGGMYIKTDADLHGNQSYVVKITNNNDEENGPEKYTEYYGIVRWAQYVNKNGSSDSPYKYGYGIEYTEPATAWCKSV